MGPRPTTERPKRERRPARRVSVAQLVAHAAGARLAAEASGINDAHLGAQLAVAEMHLLFVRAGGGGQRQWPAI